MLGTSMLRCRRPGHSVQRSTACARSHKGMKPATATLTHFHLASYPSAYSKPCHRQQNFPATSTLPLKNPSTMASALRPSAACIARRQASGELLRMQLSELVPGMAARRTNLTRLPQHAPP